MQFPLVGSLSPVSARCYPASYQEDQACIHTLTFHRASSVLSPSVILGLLCNHTYEVKLHPTGKEAGHGRGKEFPQSRQGARGRARTGSQQAGPKSILFTLTPAAPVSWPPAAPPPGLKSNKDWGLFDSCLVSAAQVTLASLGQETRGLGPTMDVWSCLCSDHDHCHSEGWLLPGTGNGPGAA